MTKAAEVEIQVHGTCKDDNILLDRLQDEFELFQKRLEKLGLTIDGTLWSESLGKGLDDNRA